MNADSESKSAYQLSRDYARLYRLIVEGQRIAAWANSFCMTDTNGNFYRDICEVRRHGEYEIMISARGTGYGNVWPFMKDEGTEEEVFKQACRSCDLIWIDPWPSRE